MESAFHVGAQPVSVVDDDADAECLGEQCRQLAVQAARLEPVPGVELLGGAIEWIDVVAPVVKEVADLLERHGLLSAGLHVEVGASVHGLEFGRSIVQAAVQIDHGLADLRHPRDQFLDLTDGDGAVGEDLA